MRAVLAGVGSRGDFQPLLALALALKQRGHDVSMYGGKNFGAWARQEGLDFVGSDIDIDQTLQSLTELNAHARVLSSAMRTMRVELRCQYARLLAMAAGADVILGMGGCIAGRSAAEAAGIPFHMVLYTPQLLPSAEYGPVMQFQRMPGWANRLAHSMVKHTMGYLYGGMLDELRREGQLVSRRDPLDFLFGPQDVLLACDPELARAPSDSALRCVELAAFSYDDRRELSPRLSDFLSAGERPVYIGFGSMRDAAAKATRESLQALAEDLRIRIVLSQRESGVDAEEWLATDRVFVACSAPHAALFERVSLAIHHGGSGTSATAARAGIPQLVVPHYFDQFFFAERLRRCGVAPEPIPRTKLSARRLKRAIRLVRSDPSYREAAQRLAQPLRARNGVALAVDYLERRYGARQLSTAAVS